MPTPVCEVSIEAVGREILQSETSISSRTFGEIEFHYLTKVHVSKIHRVMKAFMWLKTDYLDKKIFEEIKLSFQERIAVRLLLLALALMNHFWKDKRPAPLVKICFVFL